jgi:CheY-like chemotaxis protein
MPWESMRTLVGASLPGHVPGLTAVVGGAWGYRAGSGRTSDGLPEGRGECVLVVEDEAGIRQIVTEALEGLGYRVLAAGNAAEASALLAAHPDIDLLFTDIVMPGGQDGVDLARQAKRARPELPVLFTSGYAGRGPSGPSWPRDLPLLHKPYRISMLAHAIRACIDDGTARPS